MKPTLALLRKSHNNRLYNPSLPLQNRAKKSASGEGGGRPREREKKKTLKCPSSKVQISWRLDGKPAFVAGGNNIPPFPFLDSLEGKWRRRNAPKNSSFDKSRQAPAIFFRNVPLFFSFSFRPKYAGDEKWETHLRVTAGGRDRREGKGRKFHISLLSKDMP